MYINSKGAKNHDQIELSKCCLLANTGLGGSFLTIQGPTILGILDLTEFRKNVTPDKAKVLGLLPWPEGPARTDSAKLFFK